MDKTIRIEGVDKSFPTREGQVDALTNVTFDVADREFVAIVGRSGCGKSTLLRIIAGLMQHTAGSVHINGEPVRGPVPEIGIVFQTPVLLPWRTVRRNIELQLEIRGLNRAEHARTVANLITLVGLDGFEDRSPHELSGGMQQRVSLCRALIHEPSLLLMDEPFGALDAMTREAMNNELQRIWMETGKTIVFVTHSIMEAVFLADRVIVISERPGQVEEVVPVDLDRPRGFEVMKEPAYHKAVDRVRTLLHASTMSE